MASFSSSIFLIIIISSTSCNIMSSADNVDSICVRVKDQPFCQQYMRNIANAGGQPFEILAISATQDAGKPVFDFQNAAQTAYGEATDPKVIENCVHCQQLGDVISNLLVHTRSVANERTFPKFSEYCNTLFKDVLRCDTGFRGAVPVSLAPALETVIQIFDIMTKIGDSLNHR